MSIGATTGKEPDFIEDGDVKSVEELRGMMQDVHKAKLSLNQKATIEGCLTEVAVAKQQMELLHEQMRRLIGMYGTLSDEFKLYREQRIKELNVRVNSGSTTPEDIDGDNS